MKIPCSMNNEFTYDLIRLVGRPVYDPDLQNFLFRINALPLPPLPPDEFFVAHCNMACGFELQFQEATKVHHVAAQGLPARTLLLIGGYFHADGHEGFSGFQGPLPFGLTWNDSTESLKSLLGEPKNTILSKKTGIMTSQRWALSGLLLTVGYVKNSIEKIYIGII